MPEIGHVCVYVSCHQWVLFLFHAWDGCWLSMLDFGAFRRITEVNRDSNLGHLAFSATLVTNYTNGIAWWTNLHCVSDQESNPRRTPRWRWCRPTTPEVGFLLQLQVEKFPNHIGGSNLGTPAFSATLVTNYTNGISLQ